ncbi:UNVERIFIED_CONTAM: hypothetical protein Sangu_2280700 [Sesamum angustifolium]|uniref:Uncharacterized protein n=1 Tax=Sesamum angustifolium TaxID=2727405 RepID=A0AAW2L8C8_9LAMI
MCDHRYEIVDRDGKSSLLTLVKAFDSILAVYEGFCNLKQVDLKLKICRGSSIRKILVREAKSYYATEVIVGTAQTHHTIRSSASVAKYCAKKLSKDCSVLAVNNGKIVFHRESNSASRISLKGTCGKLDLALASPDLVTLERNCSICSPNTVAPNNSSGRLAEEPSDDDNNENSMAIVPVPKLEAASSSISPVVKRIT